MNWLSTTLTLYVLVVTIFIVNYTTIAYFVGLTSYHFLSKKKKKLVIISSKKKKTIKFCEHINFLFRSFFE